MINFLRRNQQAFIFFTFIYGSLTVLISYFTHPDSQFISSPFKMPFLSGIILNTLLNQNTYLLFTLLVIVFLIFIGFYFTRIAIKFLIISSRSQFPAIFFLCIAAFAVSKEIFSGAILACLFLLLCIDRLFVSVDQKGLSFRFLDSGILLGLASLFYFNILFLFPFFLLAQIILRPASWRELLYIFMGMILPFIYIFSVYYLKGLSIAETGGKISEWIFLRKTITANWYFLAGIGFYLLILFSTSIYALRKFATTKILIRKYYQLLFLLFINLLLIFIFIPSAGVELFYLFALPASVPLSIFYTQCRNSLLNNLLFLILLGIPVAINFL